MRAPFTHFLLVLVFLLGSICFTPIIHATNDSVFSSDSILTDPGFSPPPMPDSGSAGSPPSYSLGLELRDFTSKTLINDTHAILEITDNQTGQTIRTLAYVGTSGVARLLLPTGRYDIQIQVDQLDTPGTDYYYSFSQTLTSNVSRTIYLFPVGSLLGAVYSSDGQAVAGAHVKFDCGSSIGSINEQTSDELGLFRASWLPVGNCRISAASEDGMGYQDVEITHGARPSVAISLNRSLVHTGESFKPSSSPDALFLSVVVLAILILAVIAYLFMHHKSSPAVSSKSPHPPYKSPRPSVEKRKSAAKSTHPARVTFQPLPASTTIQTLPSPHQIHPRSTDIIKTLGENEKKVAEYLLHNGHHSTQARIKNSIGMPKTSLSRTLHMLERKRVVEIERIGKLKKVRLTQWFLGKE